MDNRLFVRVTALLSSPVWRGLLSLLVPVITLWLLSACQVDLTNPPRLEAQAQSQQTTQAVEPLYIPAPTGTPVPVGEVVQQAEVGDLLGSSLVVWISETSPKYRPLAQELANEFSRIHGASVAIHLVAPEMMPDLVSTAALSGTLPGVILHPIEYTAGWVEDGVLDPAAANEALEMLGRETFDPAALDLVAIDGRVSALPSDGFLQLLLYRSDWFEREGLQAPDDYAAIAAAAEAIYDREQVISGLIIPTESNLAATQRAFEQIALANGCELIDEAGEVLIQSAACSRALDHYYSTINQFSPPGVQTETSALRGYLAGRTGMIVTSPAALRAITGLDPTIAPSCPECGGDAADYLARNTGVITTIRGDGPQASDAAFSNISNLGITTAADRQAAIEFARFWFEEGYDQWLSLDSERKVPLRLGTAEKPQRFIDAWGSQPLDGLSVSLEEIVGSETADRLQGGITSAPRWGLRQGWGELISALAADNTFPIVLQEMLSGYFSPEATLRVAYDRVIEHMPGAAAETDQPAETEPTATPES